jgi:hypothetical protein
VQNSPGQVPRAAAHVDDGLVAADPQLVETARDLQGQGLQLLPAIPAVRDAGQLGPCSVLGLRGGFVTGRATRTAHPLQPGGRTARSVEEELGPLPLGFRPTSPGGSAGPHLRECGSVGCRTNDDIVADLPPATARLGTVRLKTASEPPPTGAAAPPIPSPSTPPAAPARWWARGHRPPRGRGSAPGYPAPAG